VNSDNKLKRHLNINYYDGVCNPRFNRKCYVFYFVSVIIKNGFSKLRKNHNSEWRLRPEQNIFQNLFTVSNIILDLGVFHACVYLCKCLCTYWQHMHIAYKETTVPDSVAST
jgi:hypothetical protein